MQIFWIAFAAVTALLVIILIVRFAVRSSRQRRQVAEKMNELEREFERIRRQAEQKMDRSRNR